MDLADVLIHLAEALSESNHREDSLWTFQEAMRIFEETHTQMVAKAHSIKRRDMAELNLRCGIGHITAAEHALVFALSLSCLAGVVLGAGRQSDALH